MDHDEIDLDAKQNNRQCAGRYGIKTNKTVKKHPIHTNSAMKAKDEVVNIVEVTDRRTRNTIRHAPTTTSVSLNKRKNWETVNTLKKSQDGTLTEIQIYIL